MVQDLKYRNLWNPWDSYMLTNCTNNRGIIVYIEYQSVCPLVGIGPSYPLPPQASVFPPWTQGGWSNHRLQVRGWVDPSRTTGRKVWRYVYSVPVVQTISVWRRSTRLHTNIRNVTKIRALRREHTMCAMCIVHVSVHVPVQCGTWRTVLCRFCINYYRTG